MSAKKMIQINPNFLKIGKGGKSTKKRRKRKDLRASIKPNDIKKKLMSKIKDHHHKSQNKVEEEEEGAQKFTKDFNEQLGYLEKIITSKKKKRRKRRTSRNKKKGGEVSPPSSPPVTLPVAPSPPNSLQATASHPVVIPKMNLISSPPPLAPSPPNNQAPVPIAAEPKYGCLKGGKKPTYKEYKRTLKKRDILPKKEKITFNPLPQPDPKFQDRQNKLDLLKAKISTKRPSPIKKFKRKKRTVKIFHLGKNRKKGNVSVLIKSGKTRKLIKNEQRTLRERCLSEVKQYLRKHNLIKAGTTAPEDVLRRLYEDSFLAGNVFNKNPENLLFNYLNTELDN